MKFIVLASLTATVAALAATEDALHKQLTASPGGTLVVDVDFGVIEVTSRPGNEVTIDVTRKVALRSESREEEFLAERPITVSQDGNTITLRARKPGKSTEWSWGRGRKLEAKYLIALPDRFSATLATRGGHIHVDALAGDVRANTSGGGLRFTKIRGAVNGATSGGSIQAEDCEGDLALDTSGGGIRVTGGSGSVHADTSGGSIVVKHFNGSALLDTSGGGITIENVAGALTGSTSGGSISASFLEAPTGKVELETSGGSITVSLPESSAFELDAETSGGGVSSDLAVTTSGKARSNRLRGLVNGGGKLVKLRTSGGGIRVKKAGAARE